MNTEEERIVAEYGDKIIPRFRSCAGSRST
jgi:hypothetical protein